MLEFPVPETFFPQVVLNAEEVRYYKRLGKERLNELIRIAEDAELAYKWTDIRTPKMNTSIQKTQFLDMRPATKATFASTLIKCSVLVPDTRPEEVLLAIARTKTKDYRKMMGHLHGHQAFVDGRTLFKFPSSIAASRPDYSYRAIKWCAFKGKGHNGASGDANKLDFSFLEYAGKRKPSPGSMVVGFCLQESIQREREIPLLENFGFVRGYLSRSGIIVSKTHQPNVVRITSICQIDGDIEPLVRSVLEGIMQDMVGSVVRLRGLLDRQRVSGMKFLEQWEWVANSDRKACAVCLKGFFFHRKHHCRACGEVVCSSCAPLRPLDEPIYDIKELRICTACMTKAGRAIGPETSQERTNNDETLTSDASSQDLHGDNQNQNARAALRRNYKDERQFMENESKDLMRRPSDAAKRLLENPSMTSKGTTSQSSKSKRRLSTFMKNPRESVQTLSQLVDQIRDARDTINISISEAGESRLSFGEEDAYTELYDQMTRLRDTVEFAADDRGRPQRRPSSAMAGGTGRRNSTLARPPSPLEEDENNNAVDPETLEYRFSEESVKDDFNAVLEKTFAAAKATRAVGRAVLSASVASDHDHDVFSDVDEEADIDGELPSPSDASGYSSSDRDDQYSSATYDRVMGNLNASNLSRPPNPSYDDQHSNPSTSFHTQQPLRASRVQLLEKKIEDLQRDLMHAQRKLSYFEVDEPDAEYGSLGTLHEDPLTPDDSLVFRVKPRPMRRPSDFSRSATPPPTARGRPDMPKTRPQSEGFGRANQLPSRRSMDIGSLDRQHGEYKRRGSEFTPRPSMPAALASRASMGNRAHSTADMVSELYSVMNPTELAKPAMPPRKASSGSGRNLPSHAPPTRSASPGMPLKRPSRPPPPPPPRTEMLYVDEKGRLVPGPPDFPHGSPNTSYGLDKTASSSASYLDQSRGSSVPPRRNDSFGSAHFSDHLGENPAHEDGETSSEDNHLYDQESEDDEEDEEEEEPPIRRPSAQRPSTFFGDMNAADRAYFGHHVLPSARPSQSPPPPRRASLLAVPTSASPPPPRRASLLAAPPSRRPSMAAAPPSRGGRDERDDLRDLMEGLARPRSTSMPFRDGVPGVAPQSSHHDDPYERPSWSDGASAHRRPTSSPQIATRYDRPEYADYKYTRRPTNSTGTRSRAESGSQSHSRFDRSKPIETPASSSRVNGPRPVDGAVTQVRACLSSLHTECPSQWERHRKLQSISKILKSLQRDGARSKFRSLSHEEFQYDRVLEETPSIVQLLRLAGYVSQPLKLVMRNVNQEYIAVLLREIEDELNEMQATQDYL